MMKQMAKMQKKIEALQQELVQQTLEVSSGGGAVTVTVNLQSEVKGIKLDPEFLKEEASVVEEAVLEAVTDALGQAKTRNEQAMQAVTAEFQIPGMG